VCVVGQKWLIVAICLISTGCSLVSFSSCGFGWLVLSVWLGLWRGDLVGGGWRIYSEVLFEGDLDGGYGEGDVGSVVS